MIDKYFPANWGLEEFHCPHCHVFAKQTWSYLHACGNQQDYGGLRYKSSFDDFLDENFTISKCAHCKKIVVWVNKQIIYPRTNIIQSPNNDLPEEVKNDYLEASNILNDSPRAAAALLRLSIQKLCKYLGERGENINTDIKELVKKGLNPFVQKALDTLRITGNNAVHPGEIDLDEEPQRVVKLFELINFIADKMITEPKNIELFYSSLPEESLKAIEKRDA